MKDYYLLLTGAYNNVGDFLIVHRAKKLLEKYRPDREIIEVSRKKAFGSSLLDQVNGAKAVLITGGPALRRNIWPKMIKLSDDLSKIKSPILMYGIGWKNRNNSWQSALEFEFSEGTKELLRKIDGNGYTNSLRDYTSLAICDWNGLKNFQITGCPGMYNESGVPATVRIPEKVKSILISTGVSYLKDNEIFRDLLYIADEIKRYFPDAAVKAAFHHSTDRELLAAEYGSKSPHVQFHGKTVSLMEGFEKRGVESLDVSRDLDFFRDVYRSADAHIGYRVHGHIYTISSGKPSVLISEDSRGMGFKEIIGGPIIDATAPVHPDNPIVPMLMRNSQDKGQYPLLRAAVYMLYTELTGKSIQTNLSLDAIRLWEPHMKSFLSQLP